MAPMTMRSFISSFDAMKQLYLKLLLLMAVVGGIIFLIDRTGLFNADLNNNHEQSAWNAFYDFTKNNDVDVLLIGNSHLYTGINPNHLSCLLGANCFILASSGAPVIDTYYGLKEALTRCNPKLVVLETYGIDDKHVRKLSAGNLSNQFKSFSSRHNIFHKLVSAPVLFSSDNYLSAWSTSVRNHDFIFRDPAQIRKNKNGQNIAHHKNDLELGRFTRFNSGITESTDSLYDALGPVVDGNEFRVNRESYTAVKKIQSLCRRKGIPLVYLTVPMYQKHLTNYQSWKTILSRVIGPDGIWLDLQEQYDPELFTKDCFENTRNENQHLTSQGARICDYKLANFILDESGASLPDRHSLPDWKRLFYREDGYFERFTIEEGDQKNFLLCKNVDLEGLLIKDCIAEPDGSNCSFYLKLDKRTDPRLFSNGINLYLGIGKAEAPKYVRVKVQQVPGTDIRDHYLLYAYGEDIGDLTSMRLISLGLISSAQD